MIQVHDLLKEYSGRVLFKELSFSVNKGERVGLVGRNGSGKSTLLKIISGQASSDSGSVNYPKNYKLGILEQHFSFTHKNILDECMSVLPVEEKFETYKASKILFGFGFKEEDLGKSPESFSGGYQIRINLTKLLLQEPDLLLLDEPTNYLDIVSTRWFSRFLKKFPGEVVLITHDRSFMDEVCSHVMGIHRGNLVKVKGKVKNYHEKIAEAEAIHENTRVNQEKKKKEIEAFVTKFRAKARQASMAQSRQKMLDKMEDIDALDSVRELSFRFNYKDFSAKTFLEAKDISFAYKEGQKLFQDLSFYINKGDIIGIIGKNGKGKSTLLNCLSGELKASGDLRLHTNTEIGHFGQTNIERLSMTNTIEQEISISNTNLGMTQVKNICGTMMFPGDDALKSIKVLSGGEKSRVLLGKILAKETNLLLLDEPTNHLDQESIDSLVRELKNFAGAVVIVTHSELILRKIVNKFIVFNRDNCSVFNGNYDEFLEKIGWEEEAVVEVKDNSKPSYKEQKKLRQEIIKERAALLNPIKKKIEENEELISKHEKLVEEFNALLIEASEKQKSEDIISYSTKLKDSETFIEKAFEELDELYSRESELSESFNEKLEALKSI